MPHTCCHVTHMRIATHIRMRHVAPFSLSLSLSLSPHATCHILLFLSLSLQDGVTCGEPRVSSFVCKPESRHSYTCITSHIHINNITHTPCHTYTCTLSHIHIHHIASISPSLSPSGQVLVIHLHPIAMTIMNETCRTQEWIMSHLSFSMPWVWWVSLLCCVV